jgi:hypothetical protein
MLLPGLMIWILNKRRKEMQMKKFFLILMTCLIGMPALNAKAKPFTKGTIYVNFSLANMTSCQIREGVWSTIMTGDIASITDWLNGYESGDIPFSLLVSPPEELPTLNRLAKVFTLEYGLSSSLGLEFQFLSRSAYAKLTHIHCFTIEDPNASIPTKQSSFYQWKIFGNFNQRVYSVGLNYHMDFIKANRLDVYTGLHVGLEEMEIAFQDRKAEKFPLDVDEEFIESIKNAPLKNDTNFRKILYSQIALGARYFILDRIALQARCGLKVAFAGWPSTFFYGAGLTVEL